LRSAASLHRTLLLLCLFGAGSLLGCGEGGEDGSADQPASENTCEGRGEAFSAGMSKTTEDGELSVVLVAANPSPPGNVDNFWTLQLMGSAGSPVEGATIVAVPYMVDHDHGAAPQLATSDGAGQYELGPLGLTMPGLWEITLQLTTEGDADADSERSVVFNFCVSAS
jgi:hypothetical protein